MTLFPSRALFRPIVATAGRRFRTTLLSGAVTLLWACAVTPEPLTNLEQRSRISQDKALMFGDVEPVTRPIGLDEAMARAIKYNLVSRRRFSWTRN